MKNIVVIGAGTMGNGIAHTAAAVRLRRHAHRRRRGDPRARHDHDLREPAARRRQGKDDRGREAASPRPDPRPRPTSTPSPRPTSSSRRSSRTSPRRSQLFAKLDALTRPECILASNTSSISITKIAAATKRPDKVIGMHFMNPVPVMTLVEVIRGIATSDETYARVEELSKQMGKTPIEVNDYPGFISNRVLMPMINEAIFALYEGVATAEVDRRRDEARHEPPDGTAHARRLHRPRCLPGHPARARRRIRRSEIPAVSAAREDGRRRMARPKERPRFLRLSASLNQADDGERLDGVISATQHALPDLQRLQRRRARVLLSLPEQAPRPLRRQLVRRGRNRGLRRRRRPLARRAPARARLRPRGDRQALAPRRCAASSTPCRSTSAPSSSTRPACSRSKSCWRRRTSSPPTSWSSCGNRRWASRCSRSRRSSASPSAKTGSCRSSAARGASASCSYVADAEAAIDAFDPDRGMKALEEAFKLDRDNYELSFFLGEMFFNDGNLDRAKHYLERTLEVQPDHFDAAVFYGVLLHERQDLKGAERWLRRAIQISQESFLPYFSLGAIYARKGKLLRAQKFLEKAIQLEPLPQALLPPRHDLLRQGPARARHQVVPVRAEARPRVRGSDLPPRPLLSRPQLEPQSHRLLPGSAGAQSEQDRVPAGGQDLRRHLRPHSARRSGRRRVQRRPRRWPRAATTSKRSITTAAPRRSIPRTSTSSCRTRFSARTST